MTEFTLCRTCGAFFDDNDDAQKHVDRHAHTVDVYQHIQSIRPEKHP